MTPKPDAARTSLAAIADVLSHLILEFRTSGPSIATGYSAALKFVHCFIRNADAILAALRSAEGQFERGREMGLREAEQTERDFLREVAGGLLGEAQGAAMARDALIARLEAAEKELRYAKAFCTNSSLDRAGALFLAGKIDDYFKGTP
jgi:hypothetical protein